MNNLKLCSRTIGGNSTQMPNFFYDETGRLALICTSVGKITEYLVTNKQQDPIFHQLFGLHYLIPQFKNHQNELRKGSHHKKTGQFMLRSND